MAFRRLYLRRECCIDVHQQANYTCKANPFVRTCRLFTTFLKIHKFRNVYGLLLVREGFRIRYQTRMYIRLVDGDAISQPSMYAHSDAS